MRSYASAYKICLPTLPQSSQPDARPSLAHELASYRISWHGRRYRSLTGLYPKRGE
jgi:hypothetical protein